MLHWYVPLAITLTIIVLFPGLSVWLPGAILGR